MRQPLNKLQLYAALLPLQSKMETFKATDNATLTAEDVQLLQEVYPDVQVLTSGGLPLRINVGCPSCIREVFHVFTSLFDRLAADPHVNPVAPLTSEEIAILTSSPEIEPNPSDPFESDPIKDVPLYNERKTRKKK